MKIYQKIIPGFLATILPARTSFITTALAPTIAFYPITTLPRIIACAPSRTLPVVTASYFSFGAYVIIKHNCRTKKQPDVAINST